MKESSLDLWVDERHRESSRVGFRVVRTLFSQRSPYQQVDVVETLEHGRVLLNDGLFMVSERDEFVYHEMMAHVPLFTLTHPRRVLVIGGGDGGTVREVLRHPSVEECYLVEIDEVVLEACRRHLPQTASKLTDPRVKVICGDGVEFVKGCNENFDLILVDSTDPIGPATPLFGSAFYGEVRRILGPGGVVVSQGESPFYGLSIQKRLVETLREHFAKVYIYNFSNLTYPGGLWSFTFASDQVSPLPAPHGDFSSQRVSDLGLEFQWYSAEMHEASFALPAFMKREIQV